MEAVELHPAFIFDCPECGRENVLRGCVMETGLLEALGIEKPRPDDFFYISIPASVQCWSCNSRFEAHERGGGL